MPTQTIHALVQEDSGFYIGECLELAIVSQGRTLQEFVDNFRQAVTLHLEGEDLSALGLAQDPRLRLICDLPLTP